MKYPLKGEIMMRHLRTPMKMVRYMDNRHPYNEKDIESPLTTQLMVHYILKALVICLCTFGCMFQITSIIQMFFDYPTTVSVNVKTMDKLYLPGITLCNSNRLMVSKIKNYDKVFDEKWKEYTNISDTDDPEIELRKQGLIDEYLRKMMSELTVSEFMSYGHSADDFLIPTFFKCASDKLHPTEPCKKYANVITTAQELGNCFTLFHRSRSEILYTNAIDSGLSQSPVRRGSASEAVNIEISEEPFHPNEILRLKLDFHANEYTTLNEPVLGHIIIHDNDEAPVVREKNFLLFPGYYYEFFLIKETDHLLPKPYGTDCVDHRSTSYDGNEDTNEYLHHPLSRENCIIGCMAQNTIDKCNCWPPELPFMRGSIDNAQENQMKWCDWDSDFAPMVKPSNTTWFQFCFSIHEDQCNSKCNYDCSIDRYRIVKEVRVWPATERIDLNDQEHSKIGDYLAEMRQCCAIVSIRYWSAEATINRYQPKFDTAEFSSYIGGLLSMWVGFSLLGVYDFVEAIVLYIRKQLNDKTKDNTNLVLVNNSKQLVPYDTRANYDPKYRSQQMRKIWQRKARVAAIIDRWTRSPNPIPRANSYHPSDRNGTTGAQ